MKKTITIVVSAMNLGGAQRVVSILCDHWSNNSYEVNLVSTFTGTKENHYRVNSNVKLIYLDKNRFLSKSKFLNLIWKFIQLRAIFKKHKPDYIISFLTRINIASALAAFGLKRKLIISERTWTPFATLNKKYFWLYRILFKSVNNVIVQTDQSKDWLSSYFPSLSANVIPNPTIYPLPIQKEKSIKPKSVVNMKKKIILASGRMHVYKQFDLLIKAFSDLSKIYLDWDLVILGSGDEREELQKLVLKLEIESRVHMPGSVGNISDWYERADIFALSSVVEGFPNVLLEAMTYGLPCISFDCDTGPREMIQNNINGILIQPDKKEQGLFIGLKRLIENPELRVSISNQEIKIRDQYSKNNIMQKWDNILEQE